MARNKSHKARVFCIGWHKTGTTTMGVALLQLGYSVLGCRLDMGLPLLQGDKELALEEAGKFDALQDVPWAALYRELDQRYPGSRFILTYREDKAWLNSAVKHFKGLDVDLHEWLYGNGVLLGNEQLYLERYQQHNKEVRAYFAGRDDFLEMDLAAGDGWDKLCTFLGEPVPKKAFPHTNKGQHNYTWKDKLKRKLIALVPNALRRKRVEVLERMDMHDGRNRFNNHEQNKKWREQNSI